MNKTNSILEVNGNHYDAVTGQLISAGQKMKQSTATSGKKMIDGFVMGAHHTKRTLKKSVATNRSDADRPKIPAQGVHQTPQRPKTLIRKGLKKPSTSTSEVKTLAVKRVHHDAIKSIRAKAVPLNSNVKRFGHFSPRASSEVVVAKAVAKPRPQIHNQTSPTVAERVPSMVTSVSHKKLEKMLDEALLKADAHKQMMRGSKQGLTKRFMSYPKWLSFGLVGFLLAAIAAFLIWQNLPSVAVHVAAAKAHVNATMPAYTPRGYSFAGPVKYKSGAITMQFKDKENSTKTFSLVQKASDWNSASLEANALPKESNVQTSEVNGTTVYIYGENNDAMWVNHSVLYNIKNQAQLTSDQVLRIVQGL